MAPFKAYIRNLQKKLSVYQFQSTKKNINIPLTGQRTIDKIGRVLTKFNIATWHTCILLLIVFIFNTG